MINFFHQYTFKFFSLANQSLFVSYGIVTFNKDQNYYPSSLLSDGSTTNSRLNSDLSLMSTSHQQQPSNIYSFNNISSSSHIFRTLSLSTNNIGDNTSGHIRTSNGSIIVFDENSSDQTTYLLGSPSITLIDDTNLTRLSSANLPLTHINEEKHSSNDPYALTEPLNLQNSSSLSNPRTSLTKSSEQSFNYTDLLLPLNLGDEQQELNSSNDLTEEKNQQSSSILYTDIDFHQTQRRDRIAQFAAVSETKDQIPPFVL